MNNHLKIRTVFDHVLVWAGHSSLYLGEYIVGIRNPIHGFIIYDTAKITIPCREYI
jgi:hypothetical protein